MDTLQGRSKGGTGPVRRKASFLKIKKPEWIDDHADPLQEYHFEKAFGKPDESSSSSEDEDGDVKMAEPEKPEVRDPTKGMMVKGKWVKFRAKSTRKRRLSFKGREHCGGVSKKRRLD